MRSVHNHLQRYARRFTALAILGALYLLARMPTISDSKRHVLAGRFRFERAALPLVAGPEIRSARSTSPSLRHLAAWISSVGAAVALNDLDGDGLSNDLCYVDVRTDQVIVAPVPGTGSRYAPFALDAGPLFSRATMAPLGCVPADMNEDGRVDLLVYYWGRPPLAFLKHGAAMEAGSYQPVEIVPGGERWFSNTAVFADLDGDGHPDLIVANYWPDGSRLLDAAAGAPESMPGSNSRAFNGGTKHFLLWQGAGEDWVRYREVPGLLPNEVDHGWTIAVGAADLDGDLLPEIYLANDFGPDRLLHNRSTPGHLRFELLHGVKTLGVPNSKVLGRDSFHGMGVDFGDVNGDGWPDLFVSNIGAPYETEENNFLWTSTGQVDLMRKGIAPYEDRSDTLGVARSGWAWDCRLADFDNDGVPEAIQAVGFIHGNVNRWPEMQEVAMGNDALLSHPGSWHHFVSGDDLSGQTHNPFYVRSSDGRYYDVAAEMGMAETHVSRGIAVADVDGDGRLDYAVANQWEDSLFFHNVSPRPGNFLGLRVQRTNGSPVIGAKATVFLPDGRMLSAQSDGGTGFSGKRSAEIHFGLGALSPEVALRVEVKWRDTGGIHSQRYSLKPGWHVVTLGGRS